MDINGYSEVAEGTPGAEWEASLDELFGDLFGAFSDALVPSLIEVELEVQQELIDSKQYCSAIIRQAAFVETLLQMGIVAELESYRGESLSNNELEAVESIGNTPTVYIASALGLLNDSEYEAYTKLMDTRNDVAHNWWAAFSDDDIDYFEHVTERVYSALHSAFEDIN